MNNTTPKANAWVADAPLYVAGQHAAGAIVLSANENPLGASPLAMQALQELQPHRYPEGDAATLRQAIATRHNLPADNIVCGAGSDELITLLIRAYCSPDDEIIYSEHGFLMYAISAQLAAVRPVKAKEKDFHCDPQAILDSITDRTKIIFIANPNNPTGTYLTEAVLGELIAAVPSHVIIALDAAYAEYADATDYNAGEKWVKAHKNVVMLRTFSKIYGLAALRVGWMLAAEDIIATINRCRSPFNVSQAAQVAAVAALGDDTHIANSRSVNKRNMQRLQKSLHQLGVHCLPSQGNFLAVQFADEKAAEETLQFLQTHNILVRNIKAYGMGNFLRITIGSDEETDRLIAALQDFQTKDFQAKGTS